jgi:hypothetical protein
MFRFCTFSGKMGELNTGGITEALYMFGNSAIEELPCIELNNC